MIYLVYLLHIQSRKNSFHSINDFANENIITASRIKYSFDCYWGFRPTLPILLILIKIKIKIVILFRQIYFGIYFILLKLWSNL